jgi:hypothetical protein
VAGLWLESEQQNKLSLQQDQAFEEFKELDKAELAAFVRPTSIEEKATTIAGLLTWSNHRRTAPTSAGLSANHTFHCRGPAFSCQQSARKRQSHHARGLRTTVWIFGTSNFHFIDLAAVRCFAASRSMSE